MGLVDHYKVKVVLKGSLKSGALISEKRESDVFVDSVDYFSFLI